MGACRSHELKNMNLNDLKFFEGCIQVNIPQTKTKIPRNFTVVNNFYNMVKKYVDIRPKDAPSSFFLNYQNGKCLKQVIGINKFGRMGKEIATYLKLPNPEKYTGHALRRSSATLVANAGASMTTLKRHGGWKSASVAEGYIANSERNKMEIAKKIATQISADNYCVTSSPTTISSSVVDSNITTSNISLSTDNLNGIHISNCNVTINIVNK